MLLLFAGHNAFEFLRPGFKGCLLLRIVFELIIDPDYSLLSVTVDRLAILTRFRRPRLTHLKIKCWCNSDIENRVGHRSAPMVGLTSILIHSLNTSVPYIPLNMPLLKPCKMGFPFAMDVLKRTYGRN